MEGSEATTVREILIIPMTSSTASPPAVSTPHTLPSSAPTFSLSSSPISSPTPPLSLRHPQLQEEFLKRLRISETSILDNSVLISPSPSSSSSTSSLSSPSSSPRPQAHSPTSPTSPTSPSLQASLSLSSPELLSELKGSQSRPLKHVSASRGLTLVFSGRGRGLTKTLEFALESGVSANSAKSSREAGPTLSNSSREAGPMLSNGMQR